MTATWLDENCSRIVAKWCDGDLWETAAMSYETIPAQLVDACRSELLRRAGTEGEREYVKAALEALS